MGIGALIGLMSTKGFILKNNIGKWLFPQLHPTQYVRQYKIIAATLSLGLVAAGGLTTFLTLRAAVGK
jgi:hypothetical protein